MILLNVSKSARTTSTQPAAIFCEISSDILYNVDRDRTTDYQKKVSKSMCNFEVNMFIT